METEATHRAFTRSFVYTSFTFKISVFMYFLSSGSLKGSTHRAHERDTHGIPFK